MQGGAVSRPSLCALLLLIACKEPEEGAGGPGSPRGKPVQLDAETLYADYGKLEGSDILSRYAGGVTVTGSIAGVVELGETDGLQMSMAVKGEPLVYLRFADGGERARQRQPKPGSLLTVRCAVGGKPQDVLFLIDCVVP